MAIWTDGTTHFQARQGRVRRFQDGKLTAERKLFVGGDVAYDPDTKQLFVQGGRNFKTPPSVHVLDPDSLETVRILDLALWRFTSLGEGRLAALVKGSGKGPARLCIGPPGEWESERALQFEKFRRISPGICQRQGEPLVDSEPGIRASAAGLVVWDGQTGLVACSHARSTDFDQVLCFPAAAETNVQAAPAPGGVLVVSRWMNRDSRAWSVDQGDPMGLLADGYSAWVTALDDAALLAHDNQMRVIDLTSGEDLAVCDRYRGFPAAIASAGGVAIFDEADGLYEARREGDTLQVSFLAAVEKFQVRAMFPADFDFRAHKQELRQLCNRRQRRRSGDTVELTLVDLEEEAVATARAWLEGKNAADIVVEPLPR